MRLNEKQLEAVIRLKQNSDFQEVLGALDAYRHSLLEFAMFGQSENQATFCGMARSTTEIMRAFSGAEESLNLSRQRK